MDEFVLQTRGLTKIFGRKIVVNDLDLNIRKGDIYGFIGPNGAGKTTVMKVILGLLFATAGSVSLFGEPQNIKNLRRVGSLIEAPGLYGNCTAFENMKRFAILSGGTDTEIHGILELVGLREATYKRVRTFSLGMKQRLGIAIALLGKPEMLILDEPVNGLDPMGMKDVRDIILRINQERGVTFFISSHLLGELEKISTIYGIIRYGVLAEEIRAEELAERCGKSIILRCSDVQKAAEIITTQMEIPKVYINTSENRLNIDTDITRSAEINTRLIKAGIEVSELGILSKSYEDYFLEKMGPVNV